MLSRSVERNMDRVIAVCLLIVLSVIPTYSKLNLRDLDHETHANGSSYLSEVVRKNHPHVGLNVIEIIELHEYNAETHTVETIDGYRLEIHRIAGTEKIPNSKGKPVVFLQHGLLSSSMDWVITGPEKGLAFILADAGYDVWMGNIRGNVYSRRHRNLTTDDRAYWQFSWHEMGMHDLPTMIDYILKRTEQEKIFYVGHSQGSTAFFVMTSELPQYNEKIHAMFSLAPVTYCSRMFSPIFQTIARMPVKLLSSLIGKYGFNPTSDFFAKFNAKYCKKHEISQPACKSVLFLVSGFNEKQMDLEVLPAILSHLPAGASVNQIVHYGQLIRTGHFRQMDFGISENLRKYKSLRPPAYNLQNVKAPVSLHYSVNDWLSDPKDVEKLHSKLPNPIGKFRVNDDKFNHLDYLWAIDVKHLLYDKIMSIMSRYRD